MAGYYDPNKDYSKELQRTDLTSAQRSQLERERANKIEGKYGGVEPNMTGSNQKFSSVYTGSSGSAGRTALSQPGGSVKYETYDGKVGTLWNSGQPYDANVDYSALAEQYAAQGNWDAANEALLKRDAKMAATGSNGGGVSNVELWYNLNQKYGGPSSGMTLQQMQEGAEKAYGSTAAGSFSGYDPADYAMGGGTAKQTSQPTQQSGYADFDSFLSAMGYDSYAEETQRAIQAAVQKAVGDLNQQIEDTEEQSEELARRAYVAHMLGQKNLDQQLAASGLSGGMADSHRIALESNYQNELNDLNRQKEATIRELESAITNAQLTGDMQTAQELASFLQNVQSQWNSYVMNQQAMENQNYWNQQSMNADQQATARTLALAMIEQGRMPDAATLTAADMTAEQAQILLGTAGSGVPGMTPVRTGGGYDNEGLDAGTVQFMQELLGVTADGKWGQQSRGVTDMGAADSWEEIKEIMAEGGMAVAHFDAYDRSITQLVQQGYADRAREMLASISGQLSADQLKYLQRKIEGR